MRGIYGEGRGIEKSEVSAGVVEVKVLGVVIWALIKNDTKVV